MNMFTGPHFVHKLCSFANIYYSLPVSAVVMCVVASCVTDAV